MKLFLKAKDCKFLPANFDIGQIPSFPQSVAISDNGELLVGTYKHRSYVLALTPNGTMVGFQGKVTTESVSDLLIMQMSNDSWQVYERRHTDENSLIRQFTFPDYMRGSSDPSSYYDFSYYHPEKRNEYDPNELGKGLPENWYR